ncbi:hypothetical protein LCGC14_1675920 [marine sediment metagenome]|uniref:Uncharacterized protein n=1 Tax=marine sediment metagenome TaxID=412755 RepID=A0A0F9KPU6_9ZZZZ
MASTAIGSSPDLVLPKSAHDSFLDFLNYEQLTLKITELFDNHVEKINERIQELQSATSLAEKNNALLEKVVIIDLENLRDLIPKMKEKAEAKGLDITDFSTCFLLCAHAYIRLARLKISQGRLKEVENDAKNLVTMRKKKYTQDMSISLLIKAYVEGGKKNGLEKATKLFEKIQGSKYAMNEWFVEFSQVYQEGLSALMQAYIASNDYDEQDKKSITRKIFEKMSPLHQRRLCEATIPTNQEKNEKLKKIALKHIEKNELLKAEKLTKKITDLQIKTRLLKAIFDKYLSTKFKDKTERLTLLHKAKKIASQMLPYSDVELQCNQTLSDEHKKLLS